jgi:hypothetical protein
MANGNELKVTLETPDGAKTDLVAEPHVFKKGTHGWYFRNRADIGSDQAYKGNYHVQVIISKD